MKVIFEPQFVIDMYNTEKDDLLKRNTMQKILEVVIDNCLLMTDMEFYEAYGLDANPDDWCYEVIYSGEYIESYWFSIENFWNDWEDFKKDEILERFD